jgi:hypothetical protein
VPRKYLIRFDLQEAQRPVEKTVEGRAKGKNAASIPALGNVPDSVFFR